MQGSVAARPAPRAGGAGGWWRALGPTGGAVVALVVLVAVPLAIASAMAVAPIPVEG